MFELKTILKYEPETGVKPEWLCLLRYLGIIAGLDGHLRRGNHLFYLQSHAQPFGSDIVT